MSRFHVRGGFTLATFVLVLAVPVWAQQPITLQDAQRLAIARSQQLVSKDAAAASARDMGVAAGQLPDPVLKLGISNVPVNGPDRFSLTRDFMTMRSVGVMQELTRSDKRRLRVERSLRDVERLQAERVEAATVIQRETALAWIDRFYAQAVSDVVRRQLQQAQLEVDGAEIAYRNGRGSQADVFGARSAVANLQDKLRQTEGRAQSATLALGRWVGAEEARRPLGGQLDWQVSSALPLLTEGNLRQLPQLAVLATQVVAAETEVRQAQANTRSDWTVEAMYSHRGPAYSNMVSIGVSIPLQIDQGKRQDREVAAKVAALAEARADYDEALRVLGAEVKVLVNDWTAGKDRVAQLNADLLPAARLRTQAALTAYQTARGELTAVLAARREEIDAGMQVLNLEMETARLWAQLTFLIPDPAVLPVAKEQP